MSELITVVPVLGRPENVRPLVVSHHATTPGPILFMVDADDERELEAIRRADDDRAYGPGSDRVMVRTVDPGRTGRGTWPVKINKAWRDLGKDYDWMLCCADDVRFHEGWWEATKPLRDDPRIGVIGTNDLGNPRCIAGIHTTHPLVRSRYVKERGTVDQRGRVVHGNYAHQFVDDELVQTAKARAAWAPCPEAIIEHLHPYWDKGEPDAVYALGNSTAQADQMLWEERRPLVYQAGEPFPHMVLDWAIDPQVCQAVAAEMPGLDDPRWKVFTAEHERMKYEGSDESMWGPMTRRVLSEFMSPSWRAMLSQLTGIPNLLMDTVGGGYHLMPRGSSLAMHADFNRHPSGLAYRRINQLLFLNVPWEAEWDGDLVLANREHYPWQRIAPLSARLVIFTTSDHSWHGVPDPVMCPENLARKSLALYGFTQEAPPDFGGEHSTVWADEE